MCRLGIYNRRLVYQISFTKSILDTILIEIWYVWYRTIYYTQLMDFPYNNNHTVVISNDNIDWKPKIMKHNKTKQFSTAQEVILKNSLGTLLNLIDIIWYLYLSSGEWVPVPKFQFKRSETIVMRQHFLSRLVAVLTHFILSKFFLIFSWIHPIMGWFLKNKPAHDWMNKFKKNDY